MTLTDEQLQEWVEVRLKRQERIQPGHGLTLHAVVAEEALHRIVGSPSVMAEQLEHPVKASKLPTVNLRVLPFGAGVHVGMVGPITGGFPTLVTRTSPTATRRWVAM